MSMSKFKEQNAPYDSFARSVLQDRRDILIGVLKCMLPAALFERLRHFRIENTQFVTEEGRRLAADFILSAQLLGTKFRIGILILLEHKSFLDRATPEQLFQYLAHLILKRGLTPVLVGVLYHGQEEWTVPTSFKEYVMSKSKALKNDPALRECLEQIGLLDFQYFVLGVRKDRRCPLCDGARLRGAVPTNRNRTRQRACVDTFSYT